MMTSPVRVRWLALTVAMIVMAAACSTTTEPEFSSQLPPVDGGDEAGSSGSSSDPQPDPECDPDNPTASLSPAGLANGVGSGTSGQGEGDGESAETATVDLPSVSGPTLDAIRQNGRLRAGVGADGLLFGFLDPNTGRLAGFDVAIAQLMAAALFGSDAPSTIDLIPIRSAERIDRLQSGDVDIVVKTMTITCERWEQINFSATYFEAGQRLLVRADSGIERLEDLTTERICAIPGTTSFARLEQNGITTVEADTWTGCLVKVQRGEAEGVSTDDTILAGLAAQDPLMVVVGDAFSAEPYGIGVATENEDLTRFVNAVLEQAKADGTWAEIYEEWLSATLGPAPAPPESRYRDQ